MQYEYSFKKLFKLLIDRNIRKTDLAHEIGISPSTISRLSNNQMVSMNVLTAICGVLDCRLEDIMDAILIEESEQ